MLPGGVNLCVYAKRATGIDVLSAVPSIPDASPTDRILTLTSCNPRYSAAERIIMTRIT